MLAVIFNLISLSYQTC